MIAEMIVTGVFRKGHWDRLSLSENLSLPGNLSLAENLCLAEHQ
jgi:hypothetical protein